jgi:hypothetical protein
MGEDEEDWETLDGSLDEDNYVLRLRKSLNALKQAPRRWYFKLRAFLEGNGWSLELRPFRVHSR